MNEPEPFLRPGLGLSRFKQGADRSAGGLSVRPSAVHKFEAKFNLRRPLVVSTAIAAKIGRSVRPALGPGNNVIDF